MPTSQGKAHTLRVNTNKAQLQQSRQSSQPGPGAVQSGTAGAAAGQHLPQKPQQQQSQQEREQCCNPFRIPGHKIINDLRTVPEFVREKLTHVSFGRLICNSCRIRVHVMLKERKLISRTTRSRTGSNSTPNNKRQSQQPQQQQQQKPQRQQSRRSEPCVSKTSANKSNGNPLHTTLPTTPSNHQHEPASVEPPPRQSLPFAPTTARDVVEQMAAIAPEHSSSNLVENLNRLSEDIMARRSNKSQLALPADLCPSKQICCFCNRSDNNEIKFGKFYHYNGIVTHYYCLLLSSNMEQKGSDDQGILGFLPDDIHKEIRRGKRLICSHCKKNGATLGCCNAKCKRIFHLPCGLKAGSLHQFFGEFRSYCIVHRPRQKIDNALKKEIEKMSNILCYICYEEVKPLDSNETLWAPCCKKNAWFHRSCAQQLAMSAGYFFKCPLCNNKREFQTAMLEYGIYIPRQDASWELVPHAFEELLYRHDHCDSKICECPKGRTYTSSSGKWELILCRTCGSQGIHIFCGQLKWTNPTWDCPECIAILKKSNENSTNDSTTNSNEDSRQRDNTVRIENDEDSDSDISVGHETLPLESSISNVFMPQVKLRPGPKSYKVQQYQKLKISFPVSSIASDANTSNKVSDHNNANVNRRLSDVIINVDSDVDSDDEAPQIICESSMRSANQTRTSSLFSNQFSNKASSSNSSTNARKVTSIDLASPIAIKSAPKSPPEDDSEEEKPTFNIIISNVTSVPPEFFASVSEETNVEVPEVVSSILEAASQSTDPQVSEKQSSLKKRRSIDGENNCQMVKRPRFENEVSVESSQNTAESTGTNEKKSVPLSMFIGNNRLSNLTQASSSNVAASSMTACNGPSNGISSSSHESCHGDAGTRPAKYNTSRSNNDSNAAHSTASAIDENKRFKGIHINIGTARKHKTQPFHAALKHGSSSNCNAVRAKTFKPRYPSYNRTGLIPDYVSRYDLKFSVHEDNVEISYKGCKIQMKINNILEQNTEKSNDTNSNTNSMSTSSLTTSNQITSSEKSASTSLQLRSDDSDESFRNLRSLRRRTLRSFVYEDDNTLLEYPTMPNNLPNSSARITKKASHDKNAKLARNELKENWDPEISNCSVDNNLDNVNNNNNQTSSDNFNDLFNSREKSNNFDDSLVLNNDIDTNKHLLLRSNRIVRHFRSIQSPNTLIDDDSIDSDPKNLLSQMFEKSNVTAMSDQSVCSSRAPKVVKNRISIATQNKHLMNVDVNDLSFTNTGKISVMRINNEIDTNKVFKVSIDLQRIVKNQPDLFLKMINSSISKKLCIYRKDEKLRVEFKPGEKKFLTKAQSFDCLLDSSLNNELEITRVKSLNNLSQISGINSNNFMLTDKKDCADKKVRRSQRRKTLRLEKHECVR